jgi:hypothetical protein
MRGQSVREEAVADRMSCTESRGIVLSEGQLNVQDRHPNFFSTGATIHCGFVFCSPVAGL